MNPWAIGYLALGLLLYVVAVFVDEKPPSANLFWVVVGLIVIPLWPLVVASIIWDAIENRWGPDLPPLGQSTHDQEMQ